MNDLISVIIPVYNGEKYIKRCVDSILSQSYDNYEIIIINDGSSDKTLSVLREYRAYSNISIYNNRNHGVSYSRNYGMRHSNGDYIIFVDADDVMPSWSLELMHNVAVNNRSDIVCSDCGDGLSRKTRSFVYNVENKEIALLIEKMITGQNYKLDGQVLGYSAGRLYRKSILEKCEFNETVRFREDTLFNIDAFKEAEKITLIGQTCYIYSHDNKNSASYKFFDGYINEISIFLKKIRENTRDNVQAYYVCGLYTYMNYLKHYAMHEDLKSTSHLNAIRTTFKEDGFRDIFLKVNVKKIPLKYRVLVWAYKLKSSIGIAVIYRMNEVRNKIWAI